MNNRSFNILSIVLILIWIWADRYLQIGAPAYGWILLIYVSVLFCGSYFIRMGFFMRSICSAKTDEKIMAISFDDGPAGLSSLEILDILRDKEVEAAFFCIGKNIPGNENILKRMIEDDHMIGNHSYSHHHFFDLFGSGKMLSDLLQMSNICKQITGHLPRLFRPPYGVTNPNLKKAVLKGGFISIGWSIRSYDTVITNEKKLKEKIMKALKPGAILLLHDTSEITRRILPGLIDDIRKSGYQITRLDKMLKLNPYA